MKGTHLKGLMGLNPLGFFAALGVQAVFRFNSYENQPALWWSNDLVPHAIIDESFSLNIVANHAISEFRVWANSIEKLFSFELERSSKIENLKLAATDVRKYFEALAHRPEDNIRELALLSSLIAEGSLDKKKKSKPTDLNFTAGNQKFLTIAQKILNKVSDYEVREALNETWSYNSKLPSFMWDVTNSRDYALRAKNPSDDKKRTNPGAEALAILGLTFYPVFASSDRTLTTGCSGTWNDGYFSWPLWDRPAKTKTVRSLVSHAYGQKNTNHIDKRSPFFRSWGVFRIYGCSILRSDGRYGTFSPPEIIWQYDATRS